MLSDDVIYDGKREISRRVTVYINRNGVYSETAVMSFSSSDGKLMTEKKIEKINPRKDNKYFYIEVASSRVCGSENDEKSFWQGNESKHVPGEVYVVIENPESLSSYFTPGAVPDEIIPPEKVNGRSAYRYSLRTARSLKIYYSMSSSYVSQSCCPQPQSSLRIFLFMEISSFGKTSAQKYGSNKHAEKSFGGYVR